MLRPYEDPPKGNPWDHWIPAALIAGFATAIGTKLGEWLVDVVRERLKKS